MVPPPLLLPRSYPFPAHICAGTGACPVPNRQADRGSPRPHLHRDFAPWQVRLTVLHLSNNRLRALPPEIGNLTRLEARPLLCVGADVRPLLYIGADVCQRRGAPIAGADVGKARPVAVQMWDG
jgi:hypothetical protein